MVQQFVAKADYGVAPRYPGWEAEVGVVDLDEVLQTARKAADQIRQFALG